MFSPSSLKVGVRSFLALSIVAIEADVVAKVIFKL